MEQNNNFDIDMSQYDNSDHIDKDVYYMKSIYPAMAKAILAEVEDQCDQLEYEGSCMFDEVPDRTCLDSIANLIYEKVKALDAANPKLQAEEVSFNPLVQPLPYRYCNGMNCRPPEPLPDYYADGRPNWLKDLISVMLFNEMIHRRRDYFRRRRRRNRY
ncbi:hypothetical protein lbkm_3483 [Lachnospiraceae bacterium KM106-2]|nr:hypothetical protein lbkm_3483 [Lachnospiraceae bacterium KM106-2]